MRMFVCLMVFCSTSVSAHADDWPQWFGPKRDGVWREEGILDRFPKGGPKKLWSFEVAQGYASPAVANGRVFVTDYVRAKGEPPPKDVFGKAPKRGIERVFCVDAAK